ncbi:MAG: hypothetical protein H0Z19_07330 [Archaeoglobus sp.]|uniref:hypothetical protein n=1 Tax=Archaeoglobus sp. TaxID=1872626 RepID=UPI001D78C981|nr:hypothetical protein [Archaeoglobus sp.]MBO8180276.1 hypothetical protein [Archaeoglobus sp.]
MVETKWYVGTTGVKLTVETGQDLSDTMQVSLLVKKPDGSQVEWVGTANGTKIEYIIQSGDLDQAGIYRVQAKAVFADGAVWYGNTDVLVIYELFE